MNLVHEASTEDLVLCDSRGPAAATTIRTTRKIFDGSRIEYNEELPAIRYIQVEFPSEWRSIPSFISTVDDLVQHFVRMLPNDPRIEHVYWEPEDDVLKIYTVIAEPDFGLETPIYDAQLAFMDAFPKYECDFSVIYRFGKSLNEVEPQGARRVF